MIRRIAAAAVLAVLLAAAGCAGPGRASRVVLVTFDTTRADRIGCYGYEDAVTPNLDALAAQGALFERAVSPAPTTMPSHATMFTGLYPQDHGVRYNLFYKLGDEARTVAEVLQEAGWATAGFPGTHIVHSRFGLNQGFDTWIDPPEPAKEGEAKQADPAHPLAMMRPAAQGVDDALAWLDEHGDERFFVWLHFYDPHWPYTPPFPYSARFRDRLYDGELAYCDAQLGRLLQRLRALPGWEDTLVVVAGDHGEGLFDHSEGYHSLLVYESTQRVPLIVHGPGIGATRVQEPVSLADLAPTILDLAGIPAPEGVRGISLRDSLAGNEPPRRDLYFESIGGAIAYGWAELTGVRVGPWKLIDSREPELFNLEEDPGEENNLAPFDAERLAEMRSYLDTLSAPLADAADPDSAVVSLDPATAARLASLGYVSGGTSRESDADAALPRDLIHLQEEILAATGASARGEWRTVANVARYVLSQDENNRWALTAMTSALVSMKQPEDALPYARKAVERSPTGELAHAALARVYSASGKPQEAYDAVLRGREQIVADSPLLEYLRLVASFDIGREVCAEEVPAAVAERPELPTFRVLLARCQARAGDVDAALETLSDAVDQGFQDLRPLTIHADFRGIIVRSEFQELWSRVYPPEEDDGRPKPAVILTRPQDRGF